MESAARSKKSRIVSLLLSLYQPGFGHFYVLRPGRGVAFVAAATSTGVAFYSGLLARSFGTLVLTLAILLTALILSAIDAVRLARSFHSTNPLYGRWYSVLGAAVVFQLIVLAALPQIQRLKPYHIPTGSMEPTLQVNDRLVAAVASPVTPSRTGLVIFESPEDSAKMKLSRIVGLPGDTVEIRDKQLFVNGLPATERWVVHRDSRLGGLNHPAPALRQRDQFPATRIPANHVFVMGDNRDFSYDSRFFGAVPVASLHGRPLYIYWSADRRRIGLQLDRH